MEKCQNGSAGLVEDGRVPDRYARPEMIARSLGLELSPVRFVRVDGADPPLGIPFADIVDLLQMSVEGRALFCSQYAAPHLLQHVRNSSSTSGAEATLPLPIALSLIDRACTAAWIDTGVRDAVHAGAEIAHKFVERER